MKDEAVIKKFNKNDLAGMVVGNVLRTKFSPVSKQFIIETETTINGIVVEIDEHPYGGSDDLSERIDKMHERSADILRDIDSRE